MDKKRWIIRDYKNDDYESVKNLWIELYLGRAERGDSAEVIENTIKYGGKLLLLIDSENDKIIGTSWLSTDHRRLYLHHFGIKTEYQGQGLSHLLVDASISFAKELNMQVKLEVRRSNCRAIRLYQNSGFSYLGDYDVYVIRDIANALYYNEIKSE
jgi:ribosomal protein S18 acetylase RimI-like enzyme